MRMRHVGSGDIGLKGEYGRLLFRNIRIREIHPLNLPKFPAVR